MKGKNRIGAALSLAAFLVCAAGCQEEALLAEIPGEASWRQEILREPEEEPYSFVREEMSEYACRSLSGEQQVWYGDMKRILGAMQERGELSKDCLAAGLDESDIDRVFQCFMTDHPEIFYVDGYSYTRYMQGDTLIALEFSGNYTMDLQEALRRRQSIESAAERMLDGLAEGASDYEKIKYVYEAVIENTDYDLQAADNQNIYSVFVNRRSVCQGYAKACQYLLEGLGVECVPVQGSVDTGEGHAWNLVKADGSYYYMDSTWGDASYRQGEGAEPSDGRVPEINYDYLCVTTRELLRTHTPDACFVLPECTEDSANYYVREGAFFTGYDRERMRRLFARAAERGKDDVSVKCADKACFEEMKQALIDGQEIFQYLEAGTGTVSYAENEKQLSLTFWVTNG